MVNNLVLNVASQKNISLNNEIQIQTHFLFEIKVLMSFGLVDIDILFLQEEVFSSQFKLLNQNCKEYLSEDALSLTLRFVHILHAS